MLVLSRKVQQKIVIGEDITIVVTRVNGNRVTLGIEAPSEVQIIRGELPRDPSLRNPQDATEVIDDQVVA